MYLKIAFSCVLFLMCITVNAQDKAIGQVEYELHQAYLTDKGVHTGQFFTSNSVLLVGQYSSLEYSTHLITSNSFYFKNAAGEIKHYTADEIRKDPELFKIFGSNLQAAKYDTAYTYKQYKKPGHSFGVSNVMSKSLLTADTTASIKWVLATQSKVLNGLLLRSASASFRGRLWTVWYAPAIPAPTGPYRFSGLPGLIIEGADATGEINFIAKKIEFPAPPVPIAMPKPAYPIISRQDFDANQAAILKASRQLEKSSRAGNTIIPVTPIQKIAPFEKKL